MKLIEELNLENELILIIENSYTDLFDEILKIKKEHADKPTDEIVKICSTHSERIQTTLMSNIANELDSFIKLNVVHPATINLVNNVIQRVINVTQKAFQMLNTQYEEKLCAHIKNPELEETMFNNLNKTIPGIINSVLVNLTEPN